jgi:putative FmdB family regulatory protein
MPIYEYTCRTCDKQFEAVVTDGRKVRCPGCDSTLLEQRYSAFAVGASKSKGRLAKSTDAGGGCGTCGDPRGPGSCSMS